MATVVVNFEGNADALLDALRGVGTESERTADKLDKATESADDAGSAFTRTANTAGKAATALLAAGAAAGVFLQGLADQINALGDMSARTGIASSTLAGLEVAAKMSGQELADLEGVLRKVAADGLDLEETVAQIQAIPDPAERSATAMKLLGEEGGRLVQALGNTNIQTFEQFAEEFGTNTGPEAAEAAARWQRAIAGLQTVISGFLTGEGSGLLAFGSAFVENFTIGFIVLQSTITSAVGSILIDLQNLGGALSQLMAGDFAGFAQTMTEINGPADMLGDALDFAAQGYEEGTKRAFEYVTMLRSGLVPAMEETAAATSKATDAADDLGDALDKIRFKQTPDDIVDVGAAFREANRDARDFFATQKDGAEKAEEEMTKYERAVEAVTKALGGVAAISSTVSGLASAMGDAFLTFGKDADKAARMAFAANKAAGIADAIVKTAQSIMAALTIPPPVGPILAGVNAATGALQIATIAATTFDGGGPTPRGPSGGGAGAGGQAATPAPMVKAASTDRGPGYRGGAVYRHRDLDIVAADGGYPGSAFDLAPARTGQRRMRD